MPLICLTFSLLSFVVVGGAQSGLRAFCPAVENTSDLEGGANARANAIAVSDFGSVVVASPDGSVQLFRASASGANVHFCAQLTAFPLAALCVDISKNGRVVVAGSECGSLRVLDASEAETKVKTLSTFDGQKCGAALAVALNPNGDRVASVWTDGSLRIIEVSSGRTLKLVREKVCKKLSGTDFKAETWPDFQIAWQPVNGELVAVPTADGGVSVCSPATLEQKFVLQNSGHESAARCAAFSRNGLFIASAAQDEVIVWHCESRAVACRARVEGGEVVRRIRWSPVGNMLLVATESGSLCVWENAVPDSFDSPSEAVAARSAQDDLNKLVFDDEDGDDDRAFIAAADAAVASRVAAAPSTGSGAEPMDVGGDDIDDAAFLQALEAAETAKKNSSSSADAQQTHNTAKGTSKAENTTPPATIVKKGGLVKRSSSEAVVGSAAEAGAPSTSTMPLALVFDEEDVNIVEDASSKKDHFESPFQPSFSGISEKAMHEHVDSAVEALFDRCGLVELQTAFNAAATTTMSASNSNNRRVLVWNRVGRVTCVDDRSESIVEVEFADASMHRKIRITGLYAYSMGALSEAGAVLAAPAVVDQGMKAVVHFKPVSGLVGGAEWQEIFDSNEDVAGVAVGNDWVAAVSLPFFYLRIWSVSGLQNHPIQLPISHFVSMVGQGTRLVVFHSTPMGLRALVYDLALRRVVFDIPAPVSPGAELTWCGFTTTGVLVTVDNAGVARMLLNTAAWGGQWVPLLQPEGKWDTSRRWPLGWPIGATDDCLIVVRLTEAEEVETGLVLDDDNRGSPVIETVRWNMPLANPNSALSVALEGVLRRSLFLTQAAERNARKELEVDSEIVKVLVIAAKNGHTQRALELFRTLRVSKTKMVAMKWCAANGFEALFSRMEEEWRQDAMLDARSEEEQQQEENNDDGARRGASKRVSREDEVDGAADREGLNRSNSNNAKEDEGQVFDAEASALKRARSSAAGGNGKRNSNPFTSRTGMKKSASGGIMQALQRIESTGKL